MIFRSQLLIKPIVYIKGSTWCRAVRVDLLPGLLAQSAQKWEWRVKCLTC